MYLLLCCLTPRSIVQEREKTNLNISQAVLNLPTNHLGPLITSKFRSFNGKNLILLLKPLDRLQRPMGKSKFVLQGIPHLFPAAIYR